MRAPIALFVTLVTAAGCGNDAPDDELNPLHAPDIPHIVSAQEVLEAAYIPTLDPATMNDAEISKVLGEGPFCAFRYVSDGKPVLAWKRQGHEPAIAVVKLNGLLVALHAGDAADQFIADDIRMTLSTNDGTPSAPTDAERPRSANLVFEIEQRLRVGYGGYSACAT